MSSPPKWELNVFVSFKSTPPVDNFTSDLFQRLDQVGIRYFEGDNNEEARVDIKGKLQQVRFALVVFLESYVKCNMCLDRLAELIKRKKDHNLVVIPIYFLTDRAVVSNWASRGESEVALGSVEVTERVAKKEEWTNALKEAEKISGYYLKAANGDPTPDKVIDKIVERLVNEIHSLYPKMKEFEFGPFGRKAEMSQRSGGINNGIYAVYNKDCIKSITFEVGNDTDTKQQYGRSGKDRTYKVKFEDEEDITYFAGYFDNDKKRINSLEFRTNKRSTLGPFGKLEGKYFSVPSKGGKVLEFFWREITNEAEGGILTSIGARVELNSEKFCPHVVRRVGLIGETSRYQWDDGHHHANVTKIIGRYDSESIQSIEFHYKDNDGISPPPETHGRTDGNKFSTEKHIPVDPDQHLTSITGVCEGREKIIKSLESLTNLGVVGPIFAARSEEEGKTLKQNGKIVGFYGWTDKRLCGIGAYFKERSIRDEFHWDDQKYFGVREICFWYDKIEPNHIRGIRYVYDNGSEDGETIHGGGVEAISSFEEVKFALDHYPREYWTSISGCTGEDGFIKSVEFHSNRKTYSHGPSDEEGNFFLYPSTGSRIISFHSTFDNNKLKCIGVYAEAIPHIYPLKTIGPFGGLEGDERDEWDDGVHSDVRAFRVGVSTNGDVLHSISFMYDDNGSLVKGSEHGKGPKGIWIWLDFPNERLRSITVWKDQVDGETVISHLKIITTAENDYPYPRETKGKGRPYEIKLDGDGTLRYNRIGFFGRARQSYLTAIGAHFEQN